MVSREDMTPSVLDVLLTFFQTKAWVKCAIIEQPKSTANATFVSKLGWKP